MGRIIVLIPLETSKIDSQSVDKTVAASGDDLFADIRAGSPVAVATELGQPAVAGLTARYAHLALTGQLYVDKGSMARVIAGSNSPVARQILGTLSELESNDWRFLQAPANWEKGGWYDPYTRTIWYSTTGWQGELQYILGAGKGQIRNTAVLFSHELGHHDANVVTYSVSPRDSEAASVMAKRHLIAETRAMVTEVHMAQELGASRRFTPMRQAALQSGTLADSIMGSHPQQTAEVPRAEANRLVNEYLERTYGKDLIDPASGKVRPFDMRAGFGQNQIAPLAEDAEFVAFLTKEGNYLTLRQEPALECRTLEVKGHPWVTNMLQRTKFLQAGESSAASVVGHGGRALAAVGLALAANDIVGQYRQSVGAGTGRLTRVATDWAGFEVGAAAANCAVKALTMRNPYAATAFIFGTAMIASNVFDLGMGKRLEDAVGKLL